jgi:environmental stress-induced protein Ves
MEAPSPQSSLVLRASGYRRMRWKNGAGWTSEILKVHHSAERDTNDWAWRLSIAEIEADAPFSAFPGVDRELVLLSGNGLRLNFDDGESHELLPPHDKLRFAGERAAFGELVDGPTRDFNLMWKRDAVDAHLWRRPLVGTMVLFVDPGDTWAVHQLAGQARFADDSGLGEVGLGDTAILRSPAGRSRYVLDGGGEALLIRIGSKSAA